MEGDLKFCARKEGEVRAKWVEEGGGCLEIGSYHIILRLFWSLLMIQHKKKNLDLFILPYVNKPALHNNCLSKIWDDLHCSSNSVDSLIVVLVIHANNKHFACFIFIFVPKKEHVYTYPTTNTLSQFHNQLQNKYIHINFIFSLGKCSNSSSGYGIVINVFGVVWAN